MPIALAVCVEEMKNKRDVPTTQAGVDRQSHVKYARDSSMGKNATETI